MKDRTNQWLSYVLVVLNLIVGYQIIVQLDPILPAPTMDGPYHVNYVVDGDTIAIQREDALVHIRLIGIDTPEHDEPYTREAKQFVKALLADDEVYLIYDETLFDKYGRRLAYVYLADQTTMVNREVIKAGWAVPLIIAPNNRYEVEFYQLYRDAKEQRLGIFQ